MDPTFPQMKHFFRLVDEGKITSKNFQVFLDKPDGELKPVVKDAISRPLLTLAGPVKVQLAKKLVVSKFFNEKNSSVRIRYVGDNFRKCFYGKVEEQPNTDETVLRYHTLNRRSVDGPIIKELGGEDKVKTTLFHIAALILKQPNGKQGALLTNGYANIFYVHDINGVLRAVHVYWNGHGWSVYARSVEFPGEWNAGSRVVSRDS